MTNSWSWCLPGHALCCICFRCCPTDELHEDEAGDRWDVCAGRCAEEAGL